MSVALNAQVRPLRSRAYYQASNGGVVFSVTEGAMRRTKSGRDSARTTRDAPCGQLGCAAGEIDGPPR
jgi:hypothetical protein